MQYVYGFDPSRPDCPETIVKKDVNKSLPELIPVCPYCNYGGPDATFESLELVFMNSRFYPKLKEDGSIEGEYTGISEVFWETQQPAKDRLPDQPRYVCQECSDAFDDFKIATKEEFLWHQMMESRQ